MPGGLAPWAALEEEKQTAGEWIDVTSDSESLRRLFAGSWVLSVIDFSPTDGLLAACRWREIATAKNLERTHTRLSAFLLANPSSRLVLPAPPTMPLIAQTEPDRFLVRDG